MLILYSATFLNYFIVRFSFIIVLWDFHTYYITYRLRVLRLPYPDFSCIILANISGTVVNSKSNMHTCLVNDFFVFLY